MYFLKRTNNQYIAIFLDYYSLCECNEILLTSKIHGPHMWCHQKRASKRLMEGWRTFHVSSIICSSVSTVRRFEIFTKLHYPISIAEVLVLTSLLFYYCNTWKEFSPVKPFAINGTLNGFLTNIWIG